MFPVSTSENLVSLCPIYAINIATWEGFGVALSERLRQRSWENLNSG